MASYNYKTLSQLDGDIETNNRNFAPAALLLLNIDRDLDQSSIALEQYGLATDADVASELAAAYEDNSSQIMERFASFKEHAAAVKGASSGWKAFETDYAAWVVSADTVAKTRPGSPEYMAAISGEREAFDKARDHIHGYADVYSEEALKQSGDDMKADAATAIRSSILIVLVSLVVAGVLGTLVSRSAARFVKDGATKLASQSETLAGLATQLGANSAETVAQARSASNAGAEVDQSVQSVAAVIEQMEASIREIAGSASEANRVAADAVVMAGETTDQVNRLSASSDEIGQVLAVITSIAEQTNLLALNATIEAARAGEAGKGFAVVANEVKELANETARATGDIAGKVRSIQDETGGAASSIGRIAEIIDRINQIQTTIAGAVKEQTATTSEIARSVAAAASGVSDISERVTAVAEWAEDSSAGATAAEEAALALKTFADEMAGRRSEYAVSS